MPYPRLPWLPADIHLPVRLTQSRQLKNMAPQKGAGWLSKESCVAIPGEGMVMILCPEQTGYIQLFEVPALK
jgi:hypothetical protein